MRPPLRQVALLAPALLLAALVPGCKPPENVRVRERVDGPPDLVKGHAADPANRSFQLSAFHLNHVWSLPHQVGAGSYRAKITVWDYADDHSPVAELYFEDGAESTAKTVSDPNHATRPYQIHFPVELMAPILGTLRNANEPIFLYYYDHNWALGTYTTEPVGID